MTDTQLLTQLNHHIAELTTLAAKAAQHIPPEPERDDPWLGAWNALGGAVTACRQARWMTRQAMR